MDKLKKLCLFAGIVLMLVLALLCIVGSVMGAEWSKWFFTSPAGRGLGVCIGLLIVAGLFEFNEVYITKWPIAVYLGVLLVLMAGFINCICTVFAGYTIGCIGLFGLFGNKWNWNDLLTAVLVFFATIFVFSFFSLPPQLKSVFFVPHVFACFLSYIFFTRAVFLAVKQLFDKKPEIDEAIFRLVCIGFAFLTFGIAIGSVWAQFAWGDWWSWDPKETFSLAVWLIFAAFLHFRYLYGQRFLCLNSMWIIFGFFLIVLGLLLVNFSKIFAGLHSHTV
ncbi:MAG: cytochrome c biogenesis protein CcsA [Sedimentisphaerales bacterium]